MGQSEQTDGSNPCASGSSSASNRYIVLRVVDGRVEYLSDWRHPQWAGRRQLAYRFLSAREADRLTRGVGWRFIVEVRES